MSDDLTRREPTDTPTPPRTVFVLLTLLGTALLYGEGVITPAISVLGAGMARWRKRLFAFMARNAAAAPVVFGLPPQRVVELGTRLEF